MKDNPAAYWQSLEDFSGRPVVPESHSWNDGRPSIRAILSSWVWRNRFDRKLAVGVCEAPGTALWLHARRITSTSERRALANALRRSLADARRGQVDTRSIRIELDGPNVLAAENLIAAVITRLESPVEARGMARLRLLLGDGGGPLYRFGRGDLSGRLGAAMAAL